MRIILAFILLLSALPLRAAPLDEAIAAWLAEDDATALPALSALAKAGNEDAMLALGAIEPRSWDSEYVRGLDRTQRIALLRKPGGLSGESWLKSVQTRRALAEAFELGQQKSDPWPLIALGQTDAARPGLAMSFNHNPASLAESDAVNALPREMRYMVWWGAAIRLSPVAYPTPPSPEAGVRLRAALTDALSPEWTGSLQQMLFFSIDAALMVGIPVPQAANLTGRVLRKGRIAVAGDVAYKNASEAARERALESARAILMRAPEAASVRNVCTASCAETQPACVEAVWAMTGGADIQLFLHTPLDAVIPQQSYLGSPRHRGDMARLARKRFPNAAPAGLDACGARLLLGR